MTFHLTLQQQERCEKLFEATDSNDTKLYWLFRYRWLKKHGYIKNKRINIGRITIICGDCGAENTFHGRSVRAILKKIDISDWSDSYTPQIWERLPQGTIGGYCPEHA